MIELHSHSTFSDGLLTPEQLVKECVAVGISAIALTDHDTTAGIPHLMTATAAAGIRGIAGVEVSAEPPPGGTLHVLGYFVQPGDDFFQRHLKWIRDGRHHRNLAIIHKLNQLGLRITMEEVRAHASDDVVARPHFAMAMIAKGYVRNKREAFNKYLARDKSAYVERRRLPSAGALELIRHAGGVPVLAHPFSLKLGKEALRKYVRELADQGLGGIECWYPEHTPSMRREYQRIARDFNLVPCGGADFHGLARDHGPQVHGLGCMAVPDETVGLLERAAGGRG